MREHPAWPPSPTPASATTPRHARAYLTDYYSFTRDYAERIAASALTSAQKVADTVAAFTDAGCDELILFPCNPDPGQVPLTAQAAGL